MLNHEHLFNQALYLAIIFSAIPLFASMIVGVVLSVLQASTQIQENTLTFVPKLFTIVSLLYLCRDLYLSKMIDFTQNVLNSIMLIQ